MKNTFLAKALILLTLSILIFNVGNSQVLINSTGGVPDASAMLDIESDSKGLLIPRLLTLQRTALASTAAEGLLVFDSEEHSFYMFENGAWVNLSSSAGIWLQNATDVYLSDNTKNVGIGTIAPAAFTKFHVVATGPPLTDQLLGTVACFQTNAGTNYTSRVSIIGGNAGLSILDLGDADYQSSGSLLYDHTGNFMAFHTDESERMRITSIGKVGIGTDIPIADLDIVNAGIPLLSLRTSAGNGQDAIFKIKGARTASSVDDVNQIEFYNNEDGGEFQMAEISTRNADNISGTSHSDLLFKVNDGTDLIEAVRIDDTGNVGIGTTTPDASALLDLSSTHKGFLPPKMNSPQRDAIASPTAGLMIYNLDENKMQMFDGVVWQNLEISPCTLPAQPDIISGNNVVSENATSEIYNISAVTGATSYIWSVPSDATIVSGQGTISIEVDFGTTWGNVSVYATNGCGGSNPQDFFVTVGTPLAIGDFYEGGVIFWLDGMGGGLVCAVSNQSVLGVEWGCLGISISTESAIGTGTQNTLNMTACGPPGTAAPICLGLTLNTYSDWFLPSKDELNEMYLNKVVIEITALANGGTIFGSGYWSSTEENFGSAWAQDFSDGNQLLGLKNIPLPIRAVRAF